MRSLLVRHRHIVVLVLIGAVVAVEIAAFVPAAQKVSEIRAAIVGVQAKIQEIKIVASEMENMMSSGLKPEITVSELDVSQLIPAFLEEVALFGKKHNVRIYSVTPEGGIESVPVTAPNGDVTTYTRQKVSMRGTCTCTALSEFLGDLEKGPLAVVVERIEIRKTSERGTRLDVVLLVSAFAAG